MVRIFHWKRKKRRIQRCNFSNCQIFTEHWSLPKWLHTGLNGTMIDLRNKWNFKGFFILSFVRIYLAFKFLPIPLPYISEKDAVNDKNRNKPKINSSQQKSYSFFKTVLRFSFLPGTNISIRNFGHNWSTPHLRFLVGNIYPYRPLQVMWLSLHGSYEATRGVNVNVSNNLSSSATLVEKRRPPRLS